MQAVAVVALGALGAVGLLLTFRAEGRPAGEAPVGGPPLVGQLDRYPDCSLFQEPGLQQAAQSSLAPGPGRTGAPVKT